MASDSLLTASTREIRNIADVFAQSFSDMSRGAGSSAGREDPAQRKKRKADIDNLRAMKKSSNALDMFSKGVDSAKQELNRFGRQFSVMEGLDKATQQYKANVKFGVQAFEGMALAQEKAQALTGVNIKQLSEFSKEARLAEISIGGYSNLLTQLTDNQFEFFNRTGDLTDAAKITKDSLILFSQTGIVPSMEKFKEGVTFQGKYIQSLKESSDNLLKLGVTYPEVQELLKEAAQDEDIRNRLRGAASEKERRAIIQGYLARVQEFRQLGMNVEQIKKANKALETISGKGPLERYKLAAKAQASLTAMGVEGASEFADFIRAGDRATKDQRTRAREIGGDAQKTLAAARKGAEGVEFAMSAFAERGGLLEYIGKGGAFDTSLTSQVAVSKAQLKSLETIATNTEKMGLNLETGVYAKEAFKNAIENSALAHVIGGLVNVIAPGGIASAGGVGLIGALVALTASADQLYKAITLGKSDVHNALVEKVPGGEEFSEHIGNSVASALSIVNDDAANLYERNKKDRQKEMNIFERYFDNLQSNMILGPLGVAKTTFETVKDSFANDDKNKKIMSNFETVKDSFANDEKNKKIMSNIAKENIEARNKAKAAEREAARKEKTNENQQQYNNRGIDRATMDTAKNTSTLVDVVKEVGTKISDKIDENNQKREKTNLSNETTAEVGET